jgi:hypothetical protein
MEHEASADPNPTDPPPGADADDAPQALPDAPADESPSADPPALPPELERRLRRLAGKDAPHRGPILAATRGWVSRESRWPAFAARFLDFAVLTDEHLVLCSTGFFTRRPRRQVLREPLRRLVVMPVGGKPVRTVRVSGDFSRKIRLELRADEQTAIFVKELLERTAADPRRRTEHWAAIGQLGVDPELPSAEPPDDTPPVPPEVDAPAGTDAPVEPDPPGEATAAP